MHHEIGDDQQIPADGVGKGRDRGHADPAPGVKVQDEHCVGWESDSLGVGCSRGMGHGSRGGRCRTRVAIGGRGSGGCGQSDMTTHEIPFPLLQRVHFCFVGDSQYFLFFIVDVAVTLETKEKKFKCN